MSEVLQRVPAYQKPGFQQTLDRTRPHELLAHAPAFDSTLQYQYLDTGETVTVPNVWYNQPATLRVMATLHQAEVCDRHAKGLELAPVKSLTPAANQKLIEQYRQRAQALRDTVEKLKTGEQG
jgi:hypothetical protein